MPGHRIPGLTASVWLACALSVIAGGGYVLRELRGDIQEDVVAATPVDHIELRADWSQEWNADNEYIGMFRGHCELIQNDQHYTADKMVVWSRDVQEGDQRVQQLMVYLEERVSINDGETVRSESSASVELQTSTGVTLTVRGRQMDQPAQDDPLYQRARLRRQAGKRTQLLPTQFTLENSSGSTWQSVPIAAPTTLRRVRIFPRSTFPLDIESEKLTNRIPVEQVTRISGGVTIQIYGVVLDGVGDLGVISLSADRVLVWSEPMNEEFQRDTDLPLGSKYQVYLEGNIVLRQGNNVVRAERAYYDAQENRALVLNADLRSYVPTLGGDVHVRAERLRQNSQNSFFAQNAYITASQYGEPGYRLQAGQVAVEQRPESLLGGTEQPVLNEKTGQYETPMHTWITATDTTVFVEDVPLFYSPYVSGTEEDINIPLVSAAYAQDRIFGTQVLTKWDASRLLGIEKPEGVQWNLNLNYFSLRGPSVGTDGTYAGMDPWGNPYLGSGLISYVNDGGQDNLGLDRRDVIPSDPNRGRFLWRHKSFLSPDTVFQMEGAYQSDRNYLEQYYEPEFDRGKDQETLGYLKHQNDNWLMSVLVRPQTNPFEYNTQWLPRGDITVLDEPLLNSLLNWSMHSSIGYASLNNVQTPTAANDLFTPLPYYSPGQGLMAMTRQQIDAPFNLGELKISPYAMGEAAYWGDSMNNDPVSRLYGRTGVRASLMAWKAMPGVQSDFFNLNGLAHKMVFQANYGIAGSTQPLSRISQWNEFDDNSQIHVYRQKKTS